MSSKEDAVNLYLDLIKKVLTASIYEESAWEIKFANRNPFRRILFWVLKRYSLVLAKVLPFDASARAEGSDWPLFGYTMIGHRRLDNVQTCVERVLKEGVPGDLVEAGVWRGGTTIFMRALLKAHGIADRKVWVADSFEGLPRPKEMGDGFDLSHVDHLKVSLEQVKSNFKKFDLLDRQVEFIEGWFCDTLPTAPIGSVAVLRLDADMYTSTMDVLRNLYRRVSKGGFVIIDDYHSWPACRKAVTEFLANNSLDPEIKTIDWTGVYWQV